METHCDILHSLGENKQVSFQVGKYIAVSAYMKATFIATDSAFLIWFTAYIFFVLGVVQTCIPYM